MKPPTRAGAFLSTVASLLSLASGALPALDVSTSDGLTLSFDEGTGAITAIRIGGEALPLIPGQPGGLSVALATPLSPETLLDFPFEAPGGAWTTAWNADWDTTGSWVTWSATGGRDDSGHLTLGDGISTGVGIASAGHVALPAGDKTLRLTWWARAASVETTQILSVRIFDALGTDITAATPPPPGWVWSTTSQAHVQCGLHCTAPDTWESFSAVYRAPPEVASMRVSLRHWTGGDHVVHIDDLQVRVESGVLWGGFVPVQGPLAATAEGCTQTAQLASLEFVTQLTSGSASIGLRIDVQDLSDPLANRPLILRWTLPVDASGWRWWDDIDVSREVAPGPALSHTFALAGHTVSLYPLSAISGDAAGLSLAVPMSEPMAQRFECEATGGLHAVWEIALSPVTVKLGAGHASASLLVYQHDPRWGFRSAAARYQALFPEDFLKRTRREGAWLYPIHPDQIPNPEDFGFAFHETWPIDAAVRAACEAHDIGVFYYSEPWLAWQHWGSSPDKPTYDERVQRMETWASGAASLAQWVPDGGVGDSGHLLLGDGVTSGGGMATAANFAAPGGESITIRWQARTASTATTQILCVRVFDSAGTDLTPATPAPAGWFYSSASRAWAIAGITNAAPGVWEPFSRTLALPAAVAQMRLSLRNWRGGDGLVHVDDLVVERAGGLGTLLSLDFETDDGTWVTALNDDWESAAPLWLRTPRQQAAQAVLNCSPWNADGRLLIDSHPYLWHEWAPGSWNQAWPVNPDPDLALPSTFDLFHDHWILPELDVNDGVYIDSVTAQMPVGGWENHRPEHLVAADSPLTYSTTNWEPVQLAVQAQAEFLARIAAEVHGMGKLMMLNLFHEAMRFQSRHADIMGSEVTELVESDTRSRLRRTLAGHRTVTNLLQYNWGGDYATHAQIEEFIRGQLFWGFHPAISSAGGPLAGGTPDRYFLHPELYERDRPLFRRYMPVIASLSAAGWEPVTHAQASPTAQIERFGDFSRGLVHFTVRSADAASCEATVTVDLAACGLSGAPERIEVWDALESAPVSAEVEAGRLRFAADLAAGEVGVFQIRPTVPTMLTYLGSP